MSQRFYNKASVQVALVTTIGLIVITIITIYNQRSELKRNNDKMKEEINEKTAEIQRLETLLTPFRTIALEKYAGPEREALLKLAAKIQSLEEADLFKTQRIAELEIALQKTAKLAEPNRLILASKISKKKNSSYLATFFFICTKNEPIGTVIISAALPKDTAVKISDIRKTPPGGITITVGASKQISQDGRTAFFTYKPLAQVVSIDLEVSGPTRVKIQGNMGISPFEFDIM